MIGEAGQATLVAVEQLLNAAIALDEVTMQRLAELHGRRIVIELQGWNLALLFVPDAGGRVQLFSDGADSADAVIRATPLDFIETMRMERKEDQVFKGGHRMDLDRYREIIDPDRIMAALESDARTLFPNTFAAREGMSWMARAAEYISLNRCWKVRKSVAKRKHILIGA